MNDTPTQSLALANYGVYDKCDIFHGSSFDVELCDFQQRLWSRYWPTTPVQK
jgi:hypothetical protein